MKISVITVSYNSAATIQTTLDSVFRQSYKDIEYLVIDGDSSDATLAIIDSVSALPVRCVSEPDEGIYDAMNKGISLATGDVIGILNSDDFYLNESVLSDVAAIFNDDSEIEVVMGDVDFVSDNNLDLPVRSYRTGAFKPWMFRLGLMPPHPAVFVRKSAYDRVGLYKLGYKIAADFDFLTRLLLVDGAKYKVANRTWVRMRLGGASTSGLSSYLTSTREMKRSLEENGVFSSTFLLMCRLPYKFMVQILLK